MVFLDFKSFLRFGFHIVKKMWPDARNPVSPTNFPKKIIGNRKPSSHAHRRFMTQILIADAHEIMRRGVRSVLESRRDVDVCEAENGVEAVQKTKEMRPDLVILDVSMPLLDGFSAARQIKEIAPLTPILIFSLHRTEAFLEVAQKIGVSGYISKSEDIPSLLKAVEAALHNQTYFPS